MADNSRDEEIEEKLKGLVKGFLKTLVTIELMEGFHAKEFTEIVLMKSPLDDKARYFVLNISESPPESNPTFNKNIYG